MIARKKQILCYKIEDRRLVALLTEHYVVTNVFSKQALMAAVLQERPAAILAQIRPYHTDSHLICQLKKNYTCFNIPIIYILAGELHIKEKIDALNGGIDDFIVAPYNKEEVLARTNRLIKRTQEALNSNALTWLPGNNAIREQIQDHLDRKHAVAAYWVDIDHFKSFNDTYGYSAGDNVIHMLGKIIISVLARPEYADKSNFVGHIGGDDFIILSSPEHIDNICQAIIEKFDSSVRLLYPVETRERGYIESLSRTGKVERFPLMSLTVAVTVNTHNSITHYAQVSEICREIKSFLKKKPGSNFFCDRRNHDAKDVKNDLFFLHNSRALENKIAL